MSSLHACLPTRLLPQALLLLIAACASVAHAATWTVDSTSADPALNACTSAPTDCSFPGAVSRLAPSGDTIVFTVATSSAGQIQISRGVTIEAAGARLPRLVIDGNAIVEVEIRNAIFENLVSGADGGAIAIGPTHALLIQDSQFRANRSGGSGGAIHTRAREVTIARTLFEGNYAPSSAGGIHMGIGTPQFPSRLLIIDSVFRGNGVLDPTGPGRTLGQFGAIKADGQLRVRGSLFEGNESKYAAAIQSGAPLWIENSTFVGNRTFESTEGGALLLGGPVRIANSTIVGNSGVTGGGLHVYPSSDTQVVNTIIANNTGASPDISGRIYSLGHNLIRSRVGANVEGNLSGADIYNTDPRIGPLVDNGGATRTLALNLDSLARDAGSGCVLNTSGCGDFPGVGLANDQRGAGFARSRGGAVDIGAYELGSVVVNNAQDSGAGSLRQAIADAMPGDVISFARPPFDQPQTVTLSSTLVVNKTLTIVGPGAGLLTLDANNQRRHLNVDAPGTLHLSGMRFTRGNPGVGTGGAILNLGTLSADQIVVENSRSDGGGCIHNRGRLNLSRSRLSDCRADFAAALFNEAGGVAIISDSRFENNIASGPAGGIANPAGATLVLDRVSFSGNQGTIGGALNSYGTATLSHTTFSGNSASNGGAMYVGGTSTTTLTHATVTLNTAQLNGGIAAEFDAIVNLRGSVIAGNTRTVGQAPDAGGNFTSFGYNLIGDPFATSFRPNSPSLVGNLLGVLARLAPLGDNGGHSLTHAPLSDSPIIDAAGPGSVVDGRGLPRPIDFSHLANASGGNGSDMGALELQVATPTGVTATAGNGQVHVSFNVPPNNVTLPPTQYTATCGARSASSSASPISVIGLINGAPVNCIVTATGLPSAASNTVTPGLPGVFAYVPISDPASVAVVDVSNGAVVQSIALPSAPDGIAAVSPDGARVYLPSYEGSLHVIDTLTRAPIARVGMGSWTLAAAVSPDSTRVYVTTGNGVAVLDAASNTVIATIGGLVAPFGLAITPDGSRLFVTGGSSIKVIDTAVQRVIADIAVSGTRFLAISPDGRRVYAPQQFNDGMAVIDVESLSVVGNVTVPGAGRRGVVVSRDSRRVYVVTESSPQLSVIDAATLTVVATVPVSGSSAQGVDVSADGGEVYVFSSRRFTRISTATHSIVGVTSLGGAADSLILGGNVVSVGGRTPAYTSAPPAGGLLGVLYSHTLTTSGLPAASFLLDSGTLPPGLTLDGAVISGTPTALGTYSGSIRARNNVAGSATQSFQITIGTTVPRAPTISGVVAGNAQVSVAFFAPTSNGGSTITGYTATCGAQSQSGAASPLVVTGLTNGTPVTCTVIATNAIGNSTPSAPSASVTPATVPGAPTGVVASPGNTQVSVAFVAPTNNGGSSITGYTATCGSRSQSGAASPLVVTGLSNGTPVTCTVIATNAIGDSAASAPSASVTPGTLPGAPTGVVATPGNAQVSVAFVAPANNGGNAITGYTATCGSRSQSGAASPLVVTGLTNGTPVTCTVIATNVIGNSTPSAPSASVTPATVPGAPTGVVATPGNTQVSVAFVAPTNNGGNAITGYTTTCGSRSQSGAASPLVVTGLSNGTPVTCTVIATNVIGDSVPSAPSASVTPATVPGAPGLLGAAAGNGSASVRFAPPIDTGGAPILDYTVQCMPGSVTATGATSPVNVTGLTNGTLYVCHVTARNDVGSGAPSVAASVIPTDQPVADVVVTVTNGTSYVTGGMPTTYTIVVRNTGPSGVADVRLDSTLGPEFTAASWTCTGQNGGVCAANGNGLALIEPIDLPTGASVTFVLTATVAATPETPVSVLVSATLPAPYTDPDLQSNVATDGPDLRGLFRNGFE